MGGVREHERRPLGLVLGRVRPAEDIAVGEAVPIGLGMRRERLRHKADLDQGTNMRSDERVEDAVGDREVVDRRAVGPLGVDVSRAPLERSVAIAASEQVVRAKVDRDRAKRGELAEKLSAVGRVEVVGLVGAEIVPDRCVRSNGLPGMNLDFGRRGRRMSGLELGQHHALGRLQYGEKRDVLPGKRRAIRN